MKYYTLAFPFLLVLLFLVLTLFSSVLTIVFDGFSKEIPDKDGNYKTPMFIRIIIGILVGLFWLADLAVLIYMIYSFRKNKNSVTSITQVVDSSIPVNSSISSTS